MNIAHTKIKATAIWEGTKLKGWEGRCPYCGKRSRSFYDEEGRLIGIATPATIRYWCKHSLGSSKYEGEERMFTFLESGTDQLLPLSIPYP